MIENKETCLLCGDENNTHSCGNDHMCDRCCNNIMSVPDEIPWLFDWLDKIVLPYTEKVKRESIAIKENIEAIIKNMPSELVVHVREGGGPEDISATLAVSVAKIVKQCENIEIAIPVLENCQSPLDVIGEIVELSKEVKRLTTKYAFSENQQLCVGYDGKCDGDLEGTEHEEGCPALIKDRELRPYLYNKERNYESFYS